MVIRDQNGKRVTRSVRREADGSWGVTVWFGGAFNGLATSITRLRFRTRAAARGADISDYPSDPDWIGWAPVFDY